MIDATALLFLHALDRGGHGHHRPASDASGTRPTTRRASLDDRVSWLATGSLPWERS